MKAAKNTVAIVCFGLGIILMLDASEQIDIFSNFMDQGIFWGFGTTLSFASFLQLQGN